MYSISLGLAFYYTVFTTMNIMTRGKHIIMTRVNIPYTFTNNYNNEGERFTSNELYYYIMKMTIP